VADVEEASPRWLTEEEQLAWRVTLHAHMLLLRQLDIDLRNDGLSLNDYEILAFLSEAPGHRMRMTELAEATCQTRSRLSHQISRMEDRDLVRREEYPADKRGMVAVLTQAGMDTIIRVAPHHVESARRHFIDQLSPEQLKDVRLIFEPVVEYLRKIRSRD
jgi:DNA-binding MarR family transcriptional regulator